MTVNVAQGTSAATSVASASSRVSQYLKGKLVAQIQGVPWNFFTGLSTTYNTTWRQQYQMGPSGATDLRLYFANWCVHQASSPDEIRVQTVATYKAAIEYGGIYYPLYFSGGQRSVALDIGGFAESQPLALDIPAGAFFFVRVLTNVNTNMIAGQIQCNSIAGQTGNDSNVVGDSVDATGVLGNLLSAQDSPMPVAITGTLADPTKRTVCMIGDSISAGHGDTPANRGYIRYALGSNFSSISLAIPSESGAQFIAGHWYRAALIAGNDYVIEQYGINDLAGGSSASQIETMRLAIWTLAAERGAKVYATTITPDTTSTDGWATVGNQTHLFASGIEAGRVAVNQWLRAGAPISAGVPVAVGTGGATLAGQSGHPLSGVFDVGPYAESAQDSGFWAAGTLTGDGVHPNSHGVPIIAAAINTALFV